MLASGLVIKHRPYARNGLNYWFKQVENREHFCIPKCSTSKICAYQFSALVCIMWIKIHTAIVQHPLLEKDLNVSEHSKTLLLSPTYQPIYQVESWMHILAIFWLLYQLHDAIPILYCLAYTGFVILCTMLAYCILAIGDKASYSRATGVLPPSVGYELQPIPCSPLWQFFLIMLPQSSTW